MLPAHWNSVKALLSCSVTGSWFLVLQTYDRYLWRKGRDFVLTICFSWKGALGILCYTSITQWTVLEVGFPASLRVTASQVVTVLITLSPSLHLCALGNPWSHGEPLEQQGTTGLRAQTLRPCGLTSIWALWHLGTLPHFCGPPLPSEDCSLAHRLVVRYKLKMVPYQWYKIISVRYWSW